MEPRGASDVAQRADRVGIYRCRRRGLHLALGFAERDDTEIAYFADVNARTLPSRLKLFEKSGRPAPRAVTDLRRILEDKSVDAVVIATPDHWHALATVWACQADKHVYVEKPVSHSPWEGRQMVAAARKYNKVVQAGFQNRSAAYNMHAKKFLEEGELGTIHMVRVYNQKLWPNAKPVPDSPVPEGLNWDMWTGPAPLTPYNVNYHRKWNHFWRFSGGDIINDAVHQMDLARWLIGRDYPKTVYSVGGRWAQDGVFETPDTQVAVFEYDKLLMTFELTLYSPYMLKTDPVVRNSDMFPYWPQNATRIEIYGTKGLMLVGRHGGGWQVFDRTKNRKPVVKAQEYGRFPDPDHKEDFIQAIRNNRRPNADIEKGHKSTLLCQFANISYRLGGQKLVVDPKTESFVGNDAANALLKRKYREPWVVPETV
ncbi:MAG: Gfo/Idh/MocA family oxidoreductase [Planctomycetes bacterium]|nr:Gfo/Idh/MocA family oxidoreductase [Planctomycetota bacterium]